MKLHELHPAPGSRTRSKRIGRGLSAGQGKTSGRGQKGQGSRSSVGLPIGFEGGQMPLTQRLPKLRGFHNKWRREYAVVNLGKLNRFERGSTVDGAALAGAGLIAKPTARVKVLAAGSVSAPLTLRVHRISKAARQAVEAAGGSVELLDVSETLVAEEDAAPTGGARGRTAPRAGSGERAARRGNRGKTEEA